MATDPTKREVGLCLAGLNISESLREYLTIFLDFKYLTPKIRLDSDSLSQSLLFSKSFHMVCSPARCIEIVQGILEKRQNFMRGRSDDIPIDDTPPIFVWEPVPDLCRPEELAKFYDALRYVNVVSPNDMELAQMFGRNTADHDSNRALSHSIIEAGIGRDGNGILVIRAGRNGCYAFSRKGHLELPAFLHSKVLDPTGAGNSFLGALAQALVSADRIPLKLVQSEMQAASGWERTCKHWAGDRNIPAVLICATVAASFVIEQIGMPNLSVSQTGEELWNGESYLKRVSLYINRLLHAAEEKSNKEK